MSIEIDRLIIEIPGLSPDQGRDLAQRIGAALARGPTPASGATLDRVDLTLAPDADLDAGLDAMAARVAAGVRGALG